MWVVWWATIFYKQQFKIHPELDFAWADNPIEKLNDCKILHYTGVNLKSNKTFRKSDYLHYSPYYQDLSTISPDSCSYFLKTTIHDFLESKKTNRIDLSDLTVIMLIEGVDDEIAENIYASIFYLLGNINTKIVLIEIGDNQQINPAKLPDEVDYSTQHIFNRCEPTAMMNDKLTDLIKTPFVMLLEGGVITSLEYIVAGVQSLRKHDRLIILPNAGSLGKADRLLTAMFIKLLDYLLFKENQNKVALRVGYTTGQLFSKNFWELNEMNKSIITDSAKIISKALANNYEIVVSDTNMYKLFR